MNPTNVPWRTNIGGCGIVDDRGNHILVVSMVPWIADDKQPTAARQAIARHIVYAVNEAAGLTPD